MNLILNKETLASLEDIQERAIQEMRQVANPLWRRHFEDLAVACNAIISGAMRLRDSEPVNHTLDTVDTSDECH